ncbi:MAG: putative glycoside hydrolase, partial [Oscillospiraceae bacterium]
MAKPKKIKRTKNIYKSRSTGKIVIKTIIFLFFLMALVFLGYIVSKEWSARVLKSQSSSDVLSELSSSTSDLEQSSDYSSEITSNQEVDAFVDIGDMNAKYIDSSTLLTMTYTDLELLAKQLKEEGYKAVCIELKDEKGNIYYSTENKLAREISAVVSENTLLNLLAPFKANNMFTIVSINTLKDAIAPHASRNNSYVYGNNPDITWWDDNMENGGKPWLNPYLQDTRQYIIDIVKEIANCKIDEKSFVDMIMLEGFEIPCKFTSKMNALQETAPTAYKNDVLGMLYKDLQMAAGNIPVTVSYSFDNTFSS